MYVRRMGRQVVPRVKDESETPMHVKDRFTGFRCRVRS